MKTDNPDPQNILLVDDNPQNLATLSRILTEHDYQVRTAINGQVALKSVQNMLPDLILLDIRMPILDGYDVCRQLQLSQETCDIPVVFLSALDAPLDKVKAFETGGIDYITKPFQTDEVLARVDTHLRLRAMQKRLQAQNEKLETYQNHLEDLVKKRTGELTNTNKHLNTEIAERARAEHALRVSEEQYRLLAEHVKDGIVILQHHTIVFANAVFAEMVGQPTAQLLKSDLMTLFHTSVKADIEIWLTTTEGHPLMKTLQTEMTTSSGQTLWIELERGKIFWNNQPTILLTIRNIQQSKLREIRLEQERTRLHQENLTFKSTLMERYRFGQLVGKSGAMQRVYEFIVSAAASDVSALIIGESGTGKELVARTIHQVSERRAHPFVAVNCASIPETLFEREFFGHRKGAFTGADRDKPGFFDQAHNGVLFLDEVTELRPGMQAKLLRVLQDGEYFPLGSITPKQADFLLVAATNKDWKPLIEQGLLREDFFYRVCVIEIRIPPLRERKEDLLLLIEHFLSLVREKHQHLQKSSIQVPETLPGSILEALYAYEWPGNVRELQNILQRYVATQHLDTGIPLISPVKQVTQMNIDLSNMEKAIPLPEAVKSFEKQFIAEALRQNGQHKINTAKMLGIPRSTLHRKIKEHQLGNSY